MQLGVAEGVEDGEEDEACCADDGEEDCQAREDLFSQGGVGHEAALVAQPAVGQEGDVEEDGGEDAARDEERLELLGADVADVGDRLAGLHGGVAGAVLVDAPPDQEAEEGAEPD